MNLYDFDHTVYDGDASMDFIKYSLKKRPRLGYLLPLYGFAILGYVLGFKDRKQVKQIAFSFLPKIGSIEDELDDFWSLHKVKVKQWYVDHKKSSDVIVSASPEFLLKPIIEELKVNELIATRMDPKTGRIDGENCRAQEKVRRLKKQYTVLNFNEAYSDSISDKPLLMLAKHPFIVKKDKIIPLADYRVSKISKFKTPAFIRFLLVGFVNALLGVVFSYLLSFVLVSPQLAFVVGFSLSLVISYFLNSVVTFKDRIFTFGKFIKFCLSYVPNFLIQFVLVNIFIVYYSLSPLATYILAVVIAVPITYLLLSNFVFNGGKGDRQIR